MAGNGMSGAGTSTSTTTINAASTAIASADTARFQPLPPHHRSSRRWTGCFTGLACFGSQKPGGKRIVPAARTPNPNPNPNSQPHNSAQNPNSLNLSLIAPPSSPASFTNSALPSTAQSPSCFLSVNSPGVGPSSSHMFTRGPYAHETQLVSPPVFSTFTTEPSTAPLTPPPEFSQLTTPSSPDVPFARVLSSNRQKGVNFPPFSDLQSNYYPLYISTSPPSSLISPASVTPRTGLSSPLPEPEPIKTHRSAMSSTCGSPYGPACRNFISAPETPFFHPVGPAQFHLDQAQQTTLSFARARPSLSKQEGEEVEAYRASFGFSADEIITMQKNYVGVSEAADESFTIGPLSLGERKTERERSELVGRTEVQSNKVVQAFSNSPGQDVHPFVKHKEENLQKSQESSKRARPGQSCSDAEIEYRRGRSLRENNNVMAWRNSLP